MRPIDDLTIATQLKSTAELLVSGGDERIALDAASGRSRYGCSPLPDPDMVALGSSTASNITSFAFDAAERLRLMCVDQLRNRSGHEVYVAAMDAVRAQLLRYCGCGEAGGASAVLAASGTDIHLLVAELCQPRLSVLISPEETGSGLPLALQGRHFNVGSALGHAVVKGEPLNRWQGEVCFVASRAADGDLRPAALVDADYSAAVERAAAAGQSVLLVLTDVCKTGLIAPGIDAVLALRARWPDQLDVLVDACQFRVAPETLQAYLAHGFMVALTGSKFMAGPTFCGALLLPRGVIERRGQRPLPAGLDIYSAAGDWPQACANAGALSASVNFGLLLRWQAALAEMARFAAVPEPQRLSFLRAYAGQVRADLAADACFEPLPVAALRRDALAVGARWDLEQTVFPFLLKTADDNGGWRYLSCEETLQTYRGLQAHDRAGRRYQLGQPVLCGQRDGRPVSALRICASARMIADACEDGQRAAILADARGALRELSRLLARPA